MTDYETMPYVELKLLFNQIGELLDKRAALETQKARDEMQKLADDLGHASLADMLGVNILRGKKKGKRAPARIKYRNPENPAETWTGRGRPPAWMQAMIDGGKAKEDFLVT